MRRLRISSRPMDADERGWAGKLETCATSSRRLSNGTGACGRRVKRTGFAGIGYSRIGEMSTFVIPDPVCASGKSRNIIDVCFSTTSRFTSRMRLVKWLWRRRWTFPEP